MGAGNLDDTLEAAVDVARQAGALLRTYWERGVAIEHKGDIDLITEADRVSEAAIKHALSSRFPDHGIFAEESGDGGGRASHIWIVDPLDGTTNFAHGYPQFSVNIALQIDGQTVLGVTYDPLRDELFTALRGQGAFLNGRPIHVSATPRLADSLLVTGFPYDRKTSPQNNLAQFGAFLMRSQGVLRPGSAALDLAAVACGRLDGYWEFKMNPWDLAAGALMVAEAGGRVSDPSGGPIGARPRDILASNGRIHEEMMAVLHKVTQ